MRGIYAYLLVLHVCYGTARADIADIAHVSLEAPQDINLDSRTLSMSLCVRIPSGHEYNKKRMGAVWDMCTSSARHY